MVDVQLALLCDAANVSAEGKLNVLGEFNTIVTGAFPAVHPMMYLVLDLTASPAEVGEERDITVRVLNDDRSILGEIQGQVVVPTPTRPGRRVGIQLILGLPNTVYPEPGDYAFHVLVGQDEKAVVPLSVELGDLGEEEHDD